MRIAFLAQDRWELKFASKECARWMSSPSQLGIRQLKHMGRFLVQYPRVVQVLERQPPQRLIVVYGDSDHAGCTITRKSTSCTATFLGKHCVQFSSKTQTPISLSSGESEWYQLVGSTSIGIGIKSILHDYDEPKELEIRKTRVQPRA